MKVFNNVGQSHHGTPSLFGRLKNFSVKSMSGTVLFNGFRRWLSCRQKPQRQKCFKTCQKAREIKPKIISDCLFCFCAIYCFKTLKISSVSPFYLHFAFHKIAGLYIFMRYEKQHASSQGRKKAHFKFFMHEV